MSEKEQPPIMDQQLCVNGCGFFGSSNTSHMCSKCWKDTMSQSMLDAEGKKDGVSAAPFPRPAKAMDQEQAGTEEQTTSQPSPTPSQSANTTPPPAPSTVAITHQNQQPPSAGGRAEAFSVASLSANTTSVAVAPAVPVPVPTKLAAFPLSPSSASTVRAAGASSAAAPAAGGGAMLAAPVVVTSAAAPAVVERAAKVEGSFGETGAVAAEAAALPEQKNRKRCFTCSKKVGYTGIACRCNYVFCSLHRYPEQHACTFDFKTSDRNNLKRTVIGGGQFSKVDML